MIGEDVFERVLISIENRDESDRQTDPGRGFKVIMGDRTHDFDAIRQINKHFATRFLSFLIFSLSKRTKSFLNWIFFEELNYLLDIHLYKASQSRLFSITNKFIE